MGLILDHLTRIADVNVRIDSRLERLVQTTTVRSGVRKTARVKQA
jgi:hypothetical protein